MTVLDAVRSAYAVGLAVLPTREDGTKAPDVHEWTPFQTTRPPVEQMRDWSFQSRMGYGVLGGDVSGRLDPWDFDCADTFEAFLTTATATGLGDVVARIRAGYEDQSPRGGRRWLVRYPPGCAFADAALARRPGVPGVDRDGDGSDKKVVMLIELTTFSILAPSHGRTHPSGQPYRHVSGGFDTIASYTTDERDALFELARSFDQMPRHAHVPKTKRTRRAPTGNQARTTPSARHGSSCSSLPAGRPSTRVET